MSRPRWRAAAAQAARTPPGRVARHLLQRSRSAVGRVSEVVAPTDTGGLDPVLDALAREAASSAGPATLTAIGLRLRSRDVAAVLGGVGRAEDRPRWLAGQAMVLAGLGEEAARDEALEILLDVVARHGAKVLEERQQLVLAQLLYLAGDDARVTELLPVLGELSERDVDLLVTDLANPVRGGPAADAAQWAERFGGLWRRAGLLVPVADVGTAGHLFDTLHVATDAVAAARSGLPSRARAVGVDPEKLPTVTVVVPAFRPDEGLLSAVASLVAQTWPVAEIIVVDDASGSGYDPVFTAALALDPRVSVLRREHNGGSYVGRNAALERASGELVTFHDADDWAHPERVERQALALLADPAAVASHSLAMRAHDDLTRQWLGYPAVRENASSLMIRRDLLRELGGFDEVRKSGDSEFAARLQVTTGTRITTVAEVLAVTRLRTTSLSRGDFSMGWARAARIAYQGGYRAWHQRLSASGARAGEAAVTPVEVLPDLRRRRFAAPRGYAPDRDLALASGRFDVLLVADLCAPERAVAPLTALTRRLAAAGRRVALLHQEDPTALRRRRVHTAGDVQSLLDAGTAVQVHPEEPVEATLVAVLTPGSLLLDRDHPVALRTSLIWSAPRPDDHGTARERLGRHLARWAAAPVVVGDEAVAGADPAAASLLLQVREGMRS